MVSKEWTVGLSMDEQGDLTQALAILTDGEAVLVQAEGRARRNPSDRRAPGSGTNSPCPGRCTRWPTGSWTWRHATSTSSQGTADPPRRSTG